jgi:hypothetical protein
MFWFSRNRLSGSHLVFTSTSRFHMSVPKLAREHDLPLAVRGGRHNVATRATRPNVVEEQRSVPRCRSSTGVEQAPVTTV